jgi:hypothetical protein
MTPGGPTRTPVPREDSAVPPVVRPAPRREAPVPDTASHTGLSPSPAGAPTAERTADDAGRPPPHHFGRVSVGPPHRAAAGDGLVNLQGSQALAEGRPLDPAVRGRMEDVLERDLSGVRIHTGTEAASLADVEGARAFAFGGDIVFAGGEYRPGTLIGDVLLAHELAHAAQQDGGSRRSVSGEARLEEEANEVAAAVAARRLGASDRLLEKLKIRKGVRLNAGVQLLRCVKREATPEEQYEEARRVLSRAETAFEGASYVLSDPDAARRAREVSETLGRVNRAITTVESGVAIYRGVQGFRELANYDPAANPEEFARAAGEALAGLGGVLELLPPPFSSYGTFLSGAGEFFTNMRRALDPDLRWRHREDWQEAMGGGATRRGM